jgi:hypothetical protein
MKELKELLTSLSSSGGCLEEDVAVCSETPQTGHTPDPASVQKK